MAVGYQEASVAAAQRVVQGRDSVCVRQGPATKALATVGEGLWGTVPLRPPCPPCVPPSPLHPSRPVLLQLC